MKKYVAVICAAYIFNGVLLPASSMPPLKIESLELISNVIVLGIVKKLHVVDNSYDRGYQLHEATVEVVSTLKGENESKSFILPLHLGGMKGFDRALESGDIGIFFLSYIKDGQGKLSNPQAIATFEKSFFK